MTPKPPHRGAPARHRDHGNLTVYGRMPVLEALQNPAVRLLRLHLARSNQASELITQLVQLAERAGAPVSYHSKMELSRISRNSRQDQGVAADLHCASLHDVAALDGAALDSAAPDGAAPGGGGSSRLLAIDRINNPQNLGMAMRSVAAGFLDGLLLSSEPGNTGLSPLVIKASAGVFFRTPVYRCRQLAESLAALQRQGYRVIALEAGAGQSLFDLPVPERCVFVLGNETDGLSAPVAALADQRAAVPLNRGVESLNVAVTASLVSFLPALAQRRD